MKQTAKEIGAFCEAFLREKNRQPTLKEIAEQFALEESEAVFIMGSSRMPLSLHGGAEYKDGSERELIETLPAVDNQDEMLDKMLLKGAIEELPERERMIIVLRYFRDMTQSEVAEKIGVSQVQVSRIESKIIKEFKQKLIG
jgi:RNA polymerase sporulation-specific sigma factor